MIKKKGIEMAINRELTIQHLKILTSKDVLNYHWRRTIDDAISLIVSETPTGEPPVKPHILNCPSGRRRAWCGNCGISVRIGYKGDCSDFFCGRCGRMIDWSEVWHERPLPADSRG